MERAAGNEVKSFEHYFEVPDRVRTRMINKMSPDDRVRMTRCSKLCDKEAKASKNYVYEISLCCHSADFAHIIVYYRKSDPPSERLGFRLRFSERSGKKTMEYYLLNADDDVVMWKIDLEISKSLMEHVMEAFNNIMKYGQVSVKVLSLSEHFLDNADVLENVDFRITGLENLEELEVQGRIDIRQVLPRIKNPLKKLYINNWEPTLTFANCNEIYEVKDELIWWNSYLDNQQLSKVSAKRVFTWMGNLTEMAVFNFIRSWQDGTIEKEIECYEWHLRKSIFDVRKLLRLLRVDYTETGEIEVRHYKEPAKRAILQWTVFSLQFNPGLVDVV